MVGVLLEDWLIVHCDPVPLAPKPLTLVTLVALVWVMLPVTVTAPPLTVTEVAATSPRFRALVVLMVRSSALVTLTRPVKLLVVLPRVMSLALPAASVVTPPMVKAPVWVIVPLAVTFSVVAVVVPRTKALESRSVATLPLVMLTVPKSLPASDSVMLLVPAPSLVAPPTTRAPVWVILPPLVMAVR